MQAILVTTFPCLVHCFVSSIIDFAVASFPRLPGRPSCFRDGKKVPNEYGQFYRPVSLKTVCTTNIICLDLFLTFLLGSRLIAILTSLELASSCSHARQLLQNDTGCLVLTILSSYSPHTLCPPPLGFFCISSSHSLYHTTLWSAVYRFVGPLIVTHHPGGSAALSPWW